ncbi:MAG: hypothetical protein ABJA82_17740 [Myxococcales bacterium]
MMESDHQRQLVGLFRAELGRRPIHVLDIPDEYGFMEPDLVELLEDGVHAVLGEEADAV